MNIRKIRFAPALLKVVNQQGYLRRVAAYARVSTESLEQEASLDAQREYFEEYIKAHENWSFVGIYFDSGLSGLSHRKREGFNKLIEDALSGKIDLIVTKSLSRFARNTVDALTIIRKLKAANVEVYFQKENVYTLDSKGEFLLTLMSSMAQEESRSISENITWGQRKRFADGRYSVPYKRFLGYDQGGTNKLVVNEEQAKIVRLIYRLYLMGLTEKKICDFLETHRTASPSHGTRWHKHVITSILTNEKYKGDALLQKKFTVDFLSKSIKKNVGELPQYYVEKGHAPIISDEVFDLVQQEYQRRKTLNKQYSCKSILSSRIICRCGSFYGKKIAHSNDKYRKVFWRCNHFYDTGFHSPRIDDAVIRKECREATYRLIDSHAAVNDTCATLLNDMLPEKSTAEWAKTITDQLNQAKFENRNQEDLWQVLIKRIEVSPDGDITII